MAEKKVKQYLATSLKLATIKSLRVGKLSTKKVRSGLGLPNPRSVE